MVYAFDFPSKSTHFNKHFKIKTDNWISDVERHKKYCLVSQKSSSQTSSERIERMYNIIYPFG